MSVAREVVRDPQPVGGRNGSMRFALRCGFELLVGGAALRPHRHPGDSRPRRTFPSRSEGHPIQGSTWSTVSKDRGTDHCQDGKMSVNSPLSKATPITI